jgi:acyl-CoA dehydrogenase
MSMSFKISDELCEHAEALKQWGAKDVRLLARAADELHAAPEGWRSVTDTRPAVAKFEDSPFVQMAVVYEALNYGDSWLLWAEMAEGIGGGFVKSVVDAQGTEAQKKHWAEVLTKPGVRTAIALTEPQFGSDTSMVTTTATRDGEEWVINGTKMYISGGGSADYLMLVATIDKDLGVRGIKSFVFPTDTPGFKVAKFNESKLGIRNSITSELVFENCRIPLDHLIGYTGEENKTPPASAPGGQKGALGALSVTRPLMAAGGCGTAQAAIDLARDITDRDRAEYSEARWAILQSELDQMDAVVERSRRLVLSAQWALEKHGRPQRMESSAAKAYGPPNFEKIILRCMQMIGHEGTSHAHLLEKWYRDIKILDIFEGSGQIQRIIVSREIFGRDPERGD